MTETKRLQDLYIAAAAILLLFVSMLEGAIGAVLALALLAVGVVAFPGQRARGLIVAVVAAASAAVVVLLIRFLG